MVVSQLSYVGHVILIERETLAHFQKQINLAVQFMKRGNIVEVLWSYTRTCQCHIMTFNFDKADRYCSVSCLCD